MTTELKDVRRRALRSVNQDGLIDVFLGLSWLFGAAYILLHSTFGKSLTGVVAVFPMFIIFGLRGIRNRFTYPRIGYANLKSPEVKLGAMIGLLVLMLLGVGAFALTQFTEFRIPRSSLRYFPLVVALGAAGWMLYFDNRTGFVRFRIYAIVLLASMGLVFALRPGSALTFVIPAAACGGAMLAGGIAVFVRFIRTHPKQAEVPDAS